MTLSDLVTLYSAFRPCAVLTTNNCVQAVAMLISMNHDAPCAEEPHKDGYFWGYSGQTHALENEALANAETPFDVWVNYESPGSTYKCVGRFVVEEVITDRTAIDHANQQIQNRRNRVVRIFKLRRVQQP